MTIKHTKHRLTQPSLWDKKKTSPLNRDGCKDWNLPVNVGDTEGHEERRSEGTTGDEEKWMEMKTGELKNEYKA